MITAQMTDCSGVTTGCWGAMAYGEHFFEGALLYNICCRMQAFIKQMFGSARKFNAITQTYIKRHFKRPNLLLNLSNFGVGFLAFAMSNFSS